MSRTQVAKEKTTTTRHAYVQSTRLIGGRNVLNLAALRDLVAATEDYDERSRVSECCETCTAREHRPVTPDEAKRANEIHSARRAMAIVSWMRYTLDRREGSL